MRHGRQFADEAAALWSIESNKNVIGKIEIRAVKKKENMGD